MPRPVYINDEVQQLCVQLVIAVAEEQGWSQAALLADRTSRRVVATEVRKQYPEVPAQLLISYLRRRVHRHLPGVPGPACECPIPRARRRSTCEPSSDPIWNERAQALLIYLAQAPRGWGEMESWARLRGWTTVVLRNVIAHVDRLILWREGPGKGRWHCVVPLERLAGYFPGGSKDSAAETP